MNQATGQNRNPLARARTIALAILLALTILGWWRSGTDSDRIGIRHGRSFISAGQRGGVVVVEVFRSSQPFGNGVKYYHEVWSPREFLPPAYVPWADFYWGGLGYSRERFSDGWDVRACVPHWLILLTVGGLTAGILVRRKPRHVAPATGFTVELPGEAQAHKAVPSPP